MLDKHKVVFSDIAPSIPLGCGFEHVIEFKEGVKPVITMPYHRPRHYKEIERTIQELLDMGHIKPSSSIDSTYVH